MEDNTKNEITLTEMERASIYTVGVVSKILFYANEAKDSIPASIAAALADTLDTATLPSDKANIMLKDAVKVLKAHSISAAPLPLAYLVKNLVAVTRIIFRDILHGDNPDHASGAQINLFPNDTSH